MNQVFVVVPTILQHDMRCRLWNLLEADEQVKTVFVIDNGKNCNLEKPPENGWNKNIYQVPDDNLHWAKSCNLGMQHALESDCEFICLLNDDVQFQPRFFSKLVEAYKANPDAGVVVPTYNGVFCQEASNFQHNWHFKPENKEISVNYTDGTCMFFNQDLVKEIGFLEDQFKNPNWGVDVDFGYRARKANKKLYVTKRTKLYHGGRRWSDVSLGGVSAKQVYGSFDEWQQQGTVQARTDLESKYGSNWRSLLGVPSDLFDNY